MNDTVTSLKIRLLSLYLGDRSLLNILLAVIGIFIAVGFIFGTPNSNYNLMLNIASPNIWAILFITYSVGCFLRAFGIIDDAYNIIRSLLGLWIWCLVFVSFTLLDPSPTAPLEPIFAALAIAEMWAISHSMYLLSFGKDMEKKGKNSGDPTK